jgi:hypothetical protein
MSRAAATYRLQRGGAASETVELIISDAVDGVIHNAARRSQLRHREIGNELIRMIGNYLKDQG